MLEIRIAPTASGEFENTHVHASEGIDAQNPQILAGLLRQRGDSFHERCGGGDAFGVSDRRKNPLRQITADFEMGVARDEADGILEACESPSIRHLNREKNRHARRDAEDVEGWKQRMGQARPDDLAPEKTQKARGHSDVFTAALCRTF